MHEYLLIARATALQLSIPVAFASAIALALGYTTARAVIGKRHVSRVVFLCNMFAFYGLTLGFLIGASEESIARDALSGLGTILSGYFGYILSKDLHPRLKAMIPAAVICFLISLLVATTYFSKLKMAFAP